MSVRITILIENTVQKRDLLGEHGLSYGIDFEGHKVLFDTGQSPSVLANNARQLGWDLSQVEAVVLSHGHFDHTGGLPLVIEQSPNVRLYVHPNAFEGKFQRVDGKIGNFGTPEPTLAALKSFRGEIISTRESVEVVPGLFVTGEVPRTNSYETTGGGFYLDGEGRTIDPILDDQSLYFRSTQGLVVILGCAHAGVVNTVDYVKSLHPGEPLDAIVGGMHLFRSKIEHRQLVGRRLAALAPRLLAGCHCTGPLHLLFPEPIPGITQEQAITGSSYEWALAPAA